jgi:signal transduction histidine kinase
MVQNYRDKTSFKVYLARRIFGAVGFVCFAIFAAWVLDSDFHTSWWRVVLLSLTGYGLSLAIDKLVPYFEKQREETERMTAICTYAPEAISILTLPELRYHFVNEEARELITLLSGVTDPIGKTFRDVHGDTKSSGTEATLLHMAKTGTFLNKVEVRLKPKAPERREIICDMKAFPFRDQYGQIAGIAIYYQNVTEKVRARRGAEVANNEKTEFTKRAGVEIYDAIENARDKIELLQNNQVANADRPLLFGSIQNSLKELSLLAHEVTELGRIHAGEVALEPEWFPLSEVTYNVLESFGSEATAKGIRFLAPDDLSPLPTVFADRTRTRELLQTLFHNAVRLTPKGRIELRVSVEVTADNRAATEYRIIYTGYAQDSIALTYTQKLARLLNGELTLEQNKSGAGFVFRFHFEAEVPSQTKILEFGPRDGDGPSKLDEEISGSGLESSLPVKKTGS